MLYYRRLLTIASKGHHFYQNNAWQLRKADYGHQDIKTGFLESHTLRHFFPPRVQSTVSDQLVYLGWRGPRVIHINKLRLWLKQKFNICRGEQNIQNIHLHGSAEAFLPQENPQCVSYHVGQLLGPYFQSKGNEVCYCTESSGRDSSMSLSQLSDVRPM